MSIVEEKDWRVTEKQKEMIHKRIEHFSKKEASLCINMIEGIYQTRPSSKKIPTLIAEKDGTFSRVQESKTTI